MDRKKLFRIIAFLVVFISVTNFFANKFYWYYSIWYFDMIMHFLGGVWVGLASIYLFPPKDLSIKFIWRILFFVLLVGVGWEVFEVFVSRMTTESSYFNILDTISDVFFDLAGGVFAILYFLKRIMYINENKV